MSFRDLDRVCSCEWRFNNRVFKCVCCILRDREHDYWERMRAERIRMHVKAVCGPVNVDADGREVPSD